MTTQPTQAKQPERKGQQSIFDQLPGGNASGKCRACGRVLKNKISRELGIGPVCAKKEAAKAGGHTMEEYFQIIESEPVFDGQATDVVWQQIGHNLKTNVRNLVIWHSPTGYGVGFPGSGPADFALNILEMCVPHKPDCKDRDGVDSMNRPVLCSKLNGVQYACSAFAASYHQEFKRKFIQAADPTGGRIPIEQVQAFVERCKAEWLGQAEADQSIIPATAAGC